MMFCNDGRCKQVRRGEDMHYIHNDLGKNNMKRNFGVAKNETIEMLIATTLFTLGGFIFGFYQNDTSNYVIIPLAFIVIFFGLVFEVRILNKFKNEIKDTRDEINVARSELIKTIDELQATKHDLDESISKMKEIEKKVFGYSSMIFSKSSGFHPLDKTVDELQKDVKEIKKKLDKMNRGW